MKIVAIDTETTGIDLHHSARPFLVQSYDGENSLYWEWDVNPITREVNYDKYDLIEIKLLINSADIIVMHNGKFDVRALSQAYKDVGIEFTFDWSKLRDTLYATHLLSTKMPHDLTNSCLYYLGVNLDPFENAIQIAVNKLRSIARSKLPEWLIAKEGMPGNPSIKTGNKKRTERGGESERPWKNDLWLPGAFVKHAPQHLPLVTRDATFPQGWHPKEDSIKSHPYYRAVINYANADPKATFELYEKVSEEIEAKSLTQVFLQRMKLCRCTYLAEERGVVYSESRRVELLKDYRDILADVTSTLVSMAADRSFDLTMPKGHTNKSLAEFIFNVMEMPVVKKTKTGKPSADKHAIAEWQMMFAEGTEERTVADCLASRKLTTFTQYMESYDRFSIRVSKDLRRLRSSINPCGTDTLRTSSHNPSNQVVSKKKDHRGRNLRYCFGPEPGRVWIAIDYDNLELRIPAYDCQEPAMLELFEKPNDPPYFGSYHLMNASIVWPELFNPLADTKGAFKEKYPELYGAIKNFGFAVQYGAVPINGGTADKAVGIDGCHIKVLNSLPELAKYNQWCIDFARKHGYIETIGDRSVGGKGYPIECSRNQWGGILATTPLNYRTQGTACWVATKAMVECQSVLDRWNAKLDTPNYFIVMNIHDELIFDFPDSPNIVKQAEAMRYTMESVAGDLVCSPVLTCGVEIIRDNWAEGIELHKKTRAKKTRVMVS